ncbi:MAG: IclR family transcriptional regulator [Burkholderiaceae bacterium]|jgi:DNA-binding IclR family transcriptional regulator|nr:IclR family transcriptional regulator [Burkholderiaceae bacterium]NBP92805.1 IclR family transcriptional regulator [Burkholderiaceae bacterium]NCU79085.1 IclR family transcriptional regulator [Burkholderiaceae bacterium]NCY00511.1 IclR family transcriptional regulator [Burkholderiaceae bacterium]
MYKSSAQAIKNTESLGSVTVLEGSKSSMAEKVLLILELIANSELPLTLENISSGIGLAKPTAFRLLNTLVSQGFIERDANGRRFQPSAKFRLMGIGLLSADSLRSQRLAVMKRLVATIGETCNFNILDGNEVLYLDRIETSAPIRLHIDSGMRVPLHCTASGKLFLSFMHEDQIKRIVGKEPLQAHTAKTLTHYEDLMAEIKKIADQGYALDNCEYLEGSICVAVPVRDSKNKVFAALAAHGPTPRFTLKMAEQSVPMLIAAAIELEESLRQ